ncbi:unnamed protein product (macronuclear) [Paramecium tetraurelia]|uniref:Palmitoyltransferase n=1 Tax=Paramecium tetraurelia TaxID=5888 RepID=A0CU39_PARTE|nr:uncharacterized protein GSPATT00010505001 [Paramecium tetraurelia]CAK74306.1 unnamed protein product [Paramecium tetraurelia]|eukprot:XP_001441703.1 hypothetical protein (macronuclear) [Paramecium tetraurelia strain d4-2]
MKAACLFYNQKTYLGPTIFVVLQIGLHVWAYKEFLLYYYIFGPFMFATCGLYFIVRIKDPGTIPIVKVEIPLENNQIEVQIENNVKREVLNAQANDESNGQISLDQFKDGPDNDNTIQKYYPEQQQQQQADNQHILSGRGMLSSPSSEQAKINTPNKQTCISTSNAVSPPTLAAEKRFCMQCLNEQPMRAKHCQYCKKCIPMFDHHCPWIGICIGEKNKLIFLIYLFVQIAQLIVGIRISVQNIGLLVVMGIIVILLMTLLGFHTFYVAKNITTWEYLSWKRISYIDQNSRYPFDKGVLNNIRLLLQISCQTQIYEWQLQSQ